MGLLDSRVAILTGGAGNIGKYVTRLVAAEGAAVVISDLKAEFAETLAQEIRDAGGRAVADSTDVSTFAGGQTVVQRALDEFGTVDAVVTLAGRYAFKLMTELTEEDWDTVQTSHLRGTFSVLKAAAPIMMAKRYGRIVTISSLDGMVGDAYMTAYSAAKAGIIGLTRAMAIELDAYGICVNAVCPAGTEDCDSPLAARISGHCAGVAPAIAYLLSEEAGWVNGHVFDVAGVGRLGLYPPQVAQKLLEQPGGYSLEQVRDAMPRLFEPNYPMLPRQRPPLVPSPTEVVERLPEGMSPLFREIMSGRGFLPPPEKPPRTPWG